jgi:hypothetical protein
MSDMTINIPDEVCEQLRKLAETSDQPIESVLINQLKTSLPLSDLSLDEAGELVALRHLSNDALHQIAREQLPTTVQARMQDLMDQNSLGTISPEDYAELEALGDRSNRLMLRKAEAATILIERGHPFEHSDFQSSDD